VGLLASSAASHGLFVCSARTLYFALELIRGFFDEFDFAQKFMLCSAYQQREPIRFVSRTLLPPERGYDTSAAVTVVFKFCLLTQAPLDVPDMVARHDEHLNAFQQPPPLDDSHWSQTSEEGSDLHSPVIYDQTFVHEPGACAVRLPRTLYPFAFKKSGIITPAWNIAAMQPRGLYRPSSLPTTAQDGLSLPSPSTPRSKNSTAFLFPTVSNLSSTMTFLSTR